MLVGALTCYSHGFPNLYFLELKLLVHPFDGSQVLVS